MDVGFSAAKNVSKISWTCRVFQENQLCNISSSRKRNFSCTTKTIRRGAARKCWAFQSLLLIFSRNELKSKIWLPNSQLITCYISNMKASHLIPAHQARVPVKFTPLDKKCHNSKVSVVRKVSQFLNYTYFLWNRLNWGNNTFCLYGFWLLPFTEFRCQ